MRMGAAPVPQKIKRNTRKRRRKKSIRRRRKKRRRRKNESISLPSQMRVRTQNDESLACSTFSSQKPNTVAKDERTRGGRWSRRGTGERDAQREDAWCPRCRFSPAFQGGCELCVAGASSGHAWLQDGQLFPLCPLLIPEGPNSLETPRAGRPDEGGLWGAPPGAAAGSTSSGELLVPRELRLDFPLLLRMIKSYLF